MKVIAIIGGVAVVLFLLYNGHYVARFIWLNQKTYDDPTPIFPKLSPVRNVDWNNTKGGVGWGKRLLVLQSYTPNIAKYASVSAVINEEYCRKRGYMFKSVVAQKPVLPSRNPCWDKVHYITKEFESQGIPEAVPWTRIAAKEEEEDTWLFWIDSDAVISDGSKYIEAIGNSDDKADLFICTSLPLTKNVNTGAMLLRMTPWMHQFLKKWWDWKNNSWHQTKCHEQSALDEMISRDHMGIVSTGKVAFFGPTEFNSTYQYGMRMKGKFVQHYRGCSTEKRYEAFSRMVVDRTE